MARVLLTDWRPGGGGGVEGTLDHRRVDRGRRDPRRHLRDHERGLVATASFFGRTGGARAHHRVPAELMTLNRKTVKLIAIGYVVKTVLFGITWLMVPDLPARSLDLARR